MTITHHVQRPALTALLGLAVPAGETAAQDAPVSPAAQYQALLRQCHVESASFRAANTDEERKAAVERLDQFALRFVALAEANAADPIALAVALEVIRTVNSVDSLTQTTWVMNAAAFPAGSKHDAAGRAVALLQRDHLRSRDLGPVCVRMSYGLRPEYEAFLRAVVQGNPHRDVQGLACLALAQFLNSRQQKLDLVAGRPELAERYEGLLGTQHFAELRRQDRAQAGNEVEAFFEKAAGEYGDVAIQGGGTVAARARSELFELRHLAVGKQVPDIEGVDQDGQPLRLSDHRGKVVLLDFWQEQ